MDRMAVDMAKELQAHNKTGVSIISLWPGVVRTETMEKHAGKFNLDRCGECSDA